MTDTHAKDAEEMFLYWLRELEATSFQLCGLFHEDTPKPPEIEITPKEAVEEFLKNHLTFKQYEDSLIKVAEEKCPIKMDKQKWATLKGASKRGRS